MIRHLLAALALIAALTAVILTARGRVPGSVEPSPDVERRAPVVAAPAPGAMATPGARPAPGASARMDARQMRSDIGFRTRALLVQHYEKHGREFGSVSMAEYLRRAQELRDREAGGDVLEVVREDGAITRFDREHGTFVAFNRDGTIRTFFRPTQGETYFWRQAKRRG